MKRPEPLLRRLLFPGGGWAALAVFAAVAPLWTVFSNGWRTPAARAAYAFSAYALVVAICRAVPAARRAKTAVYGLPPVRRWRADAALRALVSLRAGLCVNLCFAACKLYAGIRFRSPWFGAAAVYYTVLSTMRFAVLRGVRNAPPAGPSAAPVWQMRGLRVYRRCGVLMFALNLAMTAIAAQMVWQNRAYRSPGTLIYASAAYTFYCFGSAAASAVKAHRMHDPVHAAAKMLGLAGALMSVLTLQTAMLAQFGGDAAMRRTMNAVTGACVCSLDSAWRIYGRTRKYLSGGPRGRTRLLPLHAVHSFLKECLFMEENKEIFTYTYSARQQEEVRRILQKYTSPQEDKMELLRRLDKSAQQPGTIAGIALGVCGTLMLGLGMCCTMVWTGVFALGVAVGCTGIAVLALAYPMFLHLTKRRRAQLAPQIEALSRELLGQSPACGRETER
ncbi:MAG: hypothetical protein ACLRRT_12100 [Ruthenibacterium lactatiformans]